MTDTSTLAALYSALIQGGATVLAILAGFLLTVGPVRRKEWASLERVMRKRDQDVEQYVAELDELKTAVGRLSERSDSALPYGEIEPEALDAERSALERRLKGVEAETQRLEEVLRGHSTALHAQSESLRDIRAAARGLILLLVFCVVVPAMALAVISRDPEPFWRGIYVVGAYGSALLLAVDLVLGIGVGRDEADTNVDGRSLRLSYRHLVLVTLLVSVIALLSVGLVHFPA